MEARGPSLEPASLQAFRASVEQGDPAAAETLLEALLDEGFVEEGMVLLREARRTLRMPDRFEALRTRLAPLAERAQARRTAGWQLDAKRVSVRFSYAKLAPSLDFDGGDLQRIFLRALRLEGLLPALDLGRHPRPILQMGPPLPAEVAGREEWAETVLRRAPAREPQAIVAGLSARLPPGIRIHRWEEQPSYATPVAELAESSEWSWTCPEIGRAHV